MSAAKGCYKVSTEAVKTSRLAFIVDDTGPGVPEEARGRIFEEFGHADVSDAARFDGAGLGLAVVRRLAPWARATHVKDVAPQPGAEGSFASWPSVPLGQGVVDADAVVRELARAGYDGLLAVEIDHLHPRFGTDEVAAVRQSLERLRQAVDRAV